MIVHMTDPHHPSFSISLTVNPCFSSIDLVNSAAASESELMDRFLKVVESSNSASRKRSRKSGGNSSSGIRLDHGCG